MFLFWEGFDMEAKCHVARQMRDEAKNLEVGTVHHIILTGFPGVGK